LFCVFVYLTLQQTVEKPKFNTTNSRARELSTRANWPTIQANPFLTNKDFPFFILSVYQSLELIGVLTKDSALFSPAKLSSPVSWSFKFCTHQKQGKKWNHRPKFSNKLFVKMNKWMEKQSSWISRRIFLLQQSHDQKNSLCCFFQKGKVLQK